MSSLAFKAWAEKGRVSLFPWLIGKKKVLEDRRYCLNDLDL